MNCIKNIVFDLFLAIVAIAGSFHKKDVELDEWEKFWRE